MQNLDSKIESFRKKTSIKENITTVKTRFKTVNFSRLLIDLISGIIVGFSIGYIVDKYFDTLPIFLFIFIIIGTSAGFYNFYRSIMSCEKK